MTASRQGEAQRGILLEVVEMDGPAGGNVALNVRWRALDPSGRQVAVRVLRLSEPAGPGADATAAAMSRALGTLSRDIARKLRTTEGWLP
jgi:uncharacterized lipoprotein YmbA